MSWQTCPLCKGSGIDHNFPSKRDMGFFGPEGLKFTEGAECTVCKGKKIISEITGLPPGPKQDYEVDPNKTNTTNGNPISS